MASSNESNLLNKRLNKLWTYHDKPIYVDDTDLPFVHCSQRGWTLTKNGYSEVLVCIKNLCIKQKPVVVSITLDKYEYDISIDTEIIFTIFYNFLISTNLTSASTLNFRIKNSDLEASFTSKTSHSLVFTFTVPTTYEERDAIINTNEIIQSILVYDITLNTNEYIKLDYIGHGYLEENVISSILTIPENISIISNVQLINTLNPKIETIELDKLSYDLDLDTEMIFTVKFNCPINSSLTSSSTLNFTIGTTNVQALYDSVLNTTSLIFIYTLPTTTEEKIILVPDNTPILSIPINDFTINVGCCGGGGDYIYIGGSNTSIDLTIPDNLSNLSTEIIYNSGDCCGGGCCGGGGE